MEALSTKDHSGTFRKSFHKGLVNGANLVALNFPLSKSDLVRENISITVKEETPNLFDQIVDRNGRHQKNALWGFRMLEKFLV